MKLVDEHLRSYIDDIKEVGLLRFLTWRGDDVSAAWRGAYMPATHLDDSEMASLVKFNRDHYLYYLALIEKYVEKPGVVLDLGCGSGARTALLARYSEKVVGMDRDLLKAFAAAHLNNDGGNKISWIGGDFVAWPFTQTFDYIFAVETIEHMERGEHEKFIGKAVGLLNPGGRMLMTTPKDENPERKPPHVGLWDDGDAEGCRQRFGAEISYFDHNLLRDGTSPWSDKDGATHYVVMIPR